jgi:hypothetical protein
MGDAFRVSVRKSVRTVAASVNIVILLEIVITRSGESIT